ncbi:hypothetical protein FC18_GL000215 [Lacticaseibacillus sharpeae JCM 1186 = DSM 20505]|uniref:Outer membrane protein n=3 Tax=Lacticaseibacillus sharpeae TaxID=1626 RepID=A0A0R1ZHU6_9LACO|nr:hypothetical protein FC18_GL000215 [Lacticaseibacillus sharpeae JCM 1186 = DSM 20505]
MVLFIFVQIIAGSAPGRKAGASDAHDISSEQIVSGATTTFFKNNQEIKPDSDGNLSIDSSDLVKVDYTWALPTDHHIQAGDYYTFKLPDSITPQKTDGEYPHGDLTSADGQTYGTFKIADDGTVTLTFNQLAADSDDVTGDFFYTGASLNLKTLGKQNIEIPVSQTTTQKVPVIVTPAKQYMIDKTGQQTSGGKISWTISLNNEGKEMVNPSVQEEMPAGLSFDSISIQEASVNVDGTLSPNGTKLVEGTDFTFNKDTNLITFIGKYNDTKAALSVTFNTVLTDLTQKVDTDFINKAKLNYGDKTEETPPVTSHLNYEPHEVIKKLFEGSSGNTASWKVQYYPGKSSKGITLVDTLDDNQHFDESAQISGFIDAIDGNNNFNTHTWLNPDTDFKVTYPDSKTMEITINVDTDMPVEFSYTSVLNDGVADSKKTVNNTVTDNNGHTTTGHGETGNSNTTGTPNLVKKSTGIVDEANSIDGWQVDINPNHETLSNYWMKDTLPNGLTLESGSMRMKLVDLDTGLTVSSNDYKLSTDESGFKVEFQNNLATTKDHYQLTYNTKYDTSKAGSFTNDVSDSNNDNGHGDFTPPRNTDNKKFSYYPSTKQFSWHITVNTLNKKLQSASVVDPIQSDQVYVPGTVRVFKINTDGNGNVDTAHTYGDEVTDSVRIDEPSTENNQTLTVKLPDGDTSAYMVVLSTKPKSIAHDTTDPANYGGKMYKNTASFDNGGDEEDLPANGDYFQGTGQLISKKGSTDGGSTVNWNITVNNLQAHLRRVVITDISSPNQSVDIGSISIDRAFHSDMPYDQDSLTTSSQASDQDSLTTNSQASDQDSLTTSSQASDNVLNDSLDVSDDESSDTSAYLPNTDKLKLGTDYTVDKQTAPDGTTTTTITFNPNIIIDSTYIVSYQSHVISSNGNGDLINEAKMTAKEIVGTQDTGNVAASGGVAGGSASGKIGSVELTKQDKQSGKKLANAEFNIKSENGLIDRPGTTDADGTLTWSNIPSGTYHITETKAPEGYDINPEYTGEGKTITVDNSKSSDSNPVTKVDMYDSKLGAFKLTKTDVDSGSPLQGAHFALYAKGSDEPLKGYEDIQTDSKGVYETKDLPLGEYTLKETKAPAGYQMNANNSYDFEVKAGQDSSNPVTLTVTNAPATILPHTGGPGTWQWLALGLTALALGFTAWHFRKNWEVM